MGAETDKLYEVDQEFRDSISTVDEDGRRVWVYPKKPTRGKYLKGREFVTYILMAILFAVPFIKIDGHPFFLFNLFERKFILFGVPFWPQDFYLLALGFIAFVVFIVLFTVSFGRIFCGWVCPQTIFMEMVFRRIEYWIEGDANKQKKLDKAPWNSEKVYKKGLKHSIFLMISFLISHMLMSYLIGIDRTLELIRQPPSEHLSGFIALMVFTVIFYWVFSYFREQACIAVCPYGRLQGVFVVKETIAVMYDWVRGEKRGKVKKNQDRSDLGDCIDCNLCVHVCPTGIDIRNGTQLECVNCTACMDACDYVMKKVDKPEGLIRYASYDSIEKGTQKIFTARKRAYTVVLTLIVGLLTFFLLTRSDVETTILRVPGKLYHKQENGNISNLYNVQFVNKTFDDIDLEFRILDMPYARLKRVGDQPLHVKANELLDVIYFIDIPPGEIKKMTTVVRLGVFENGKQIQTLKTKFLGPAM
ncbi:MAG: cytochrome c oxidase accessory protein CcoG [Cytophagales bacterium]|nr:cytochrome c oxidase accessory protein CcoG [Cytophagales bacterium]